MIERAGKLCRIGGWTLIKVANTTQDMRVDVPTVGTTTIEKLADARAGCLVLEPGKTILLEKPKVIELADRYKSPSSGTTRAPAGMGNRGTRIEDRRRQKDVRPILTILDPFSNFGLSRTRPL